MVESGSIIQGMKIRLNNAKLLDYSEYRKQIQRVEFLSGGNAIVDALMDGFVWIGSDAEHDIFHHHKCNVTRYVHKDLKRFFETFEKIEIPGLNR